MGHRHREVVAAEIGQPFGDDGRIIGKSTSMQTLWEMIVHVAPTEATVLISGESGTGKGVSGLGPAS